jgi:hypothetical protein
MITSRIQMIKALRAFSEEQFGIKPDLRACIQFANSIQTWQDMQFKEELDKLIKKYYGSKGSIIESEVLLLVKNVLAAQPNAPSINSMNAENATQNINAAWPMQPGAWTPSED